MAQAEFQFQELTRRDYPTPESLYDGCRGYFCWAQSHPLWEDKAFSSNGEIIHTSLAKMRIFLLEEMCNHMGLTVEEWRAYKKDTAYARVVSWAEAAIYAQKVSGAAAGLLNSNIVIRSAGLKDTIKQEVTGQDGERLFPEFDPTKVSSEALREILDARGDADGQ